MVCQTYGKRLKWRRQLRQLKTRSWVLDWRKSRKQRKWRESRVQSTGSPNNRLRDIREKGHKHVAYKEFLGHRSSRPGTRTIIFMFLGLRTQHKNIWPLATWSGDPRPSPKKTPDKIIYVYVPFRLRRKKVYTTTVATLFFFFAFSGSEASMVYTLLSGPMVYTLFPCFRKEMVYTRMRKEGATMVVYTLFALG